MVKKLALMPALLLMAATVFAQRYVSPVRSVLLRGPYLQSVTPGSVVVRWRTDVLTRGIVHFGRSADFLDRNVQDTVLATEHKLLLEGLQPDTRYFYSIGSFKDTLQTGPNDHFMTLPRPGTEALYRIAAVGDCGNNSVNQRDVRDALLKYLGGYYLNAWILLGDNAYYTGRDAEFQSNFFNLYKDNLLPKYPLYPSPGNHDYYDGDSTEEKVQHTHQVAYFQDLLERYGVDLIICGHSHDYERSQLIKGHYGLETSWDSSSYVVQHSSGKYDGSPQSCPFLKDSANGYPGTVYIVSGSAGQLGGKQASFPHDALPYSDATHGGAGMLEIQGDRLDWKWICADGEIRDRFTMMKNTRSPHVIPIRKGESVTLTAPFSGKWSNKAVGQSIVVKPSSSTVYTVKNEAGCVEERFEVAVTK
jgi:hypothetical protein